MPHHESQPETTTVYSYARCDGMGRHPMQLYIGSLRVPGEPNQILVGCCPVCAMIMRKKDPADVFAGVARTLGGET